MKACRQHQAKIATRAVKIVFYLLAHGVQVRRLNVTCDGRTVYAKMRLGTRKFTVRVSDHRPGVVTRHDGMGSKLASFPICYTWERTRRLLHKRVADLVHGEKST